MTEAPSREFGTRKPVAIAPAQPIKRGQVALLLMGTLAVGGGAYALMPRENCATDRPGIASDLQASANCGSRGSSSGGIRLGSRSSFFSSDASSNRPPSGTSSDAGSGGVTRGGFGGFAHAFASHFSRGG